MKKFMIFAGLMLTAAFSLTNCQKAEFAGPESRNGKKATITATAIQMKTTNDGLQTLWSSGDNLTVFHAIAGTTDYVKDVKFQTSQGGATSAEFEGTLPELTPGAYYDWYILNQYRGGLTSPDGTGVSYNVGVPRQQQAAYGSSAHIAGQGSFPMYGHIWNAPADAPLVVAMTHISSLLNVKVTNSTAEPIRISNVEFLANEIISGGFYVDFTKEELTFKPAAGNENKYARLSVAGGEALAPGATADFYLGIRPFKAAIGDVLELRVNGYAKKVTLTEAVNFAPGHEKVLNFSFDKPAEDLSGDYMIAGHPDENWYAAHGLALTPGAYDGSGGQNTVIFAKKVVVKDSQIYYDENLDIFYENGKNENPLDVLSFDEYKFTIAKVTEGEYAGMYTIKNFDGKYMTATATANGNSVDFLETPDSGSYFDICANGENAVDGYRIVATKSAYKRHLFFNLSGLNWPRFTLFGEGENAHTCPYLVPWGTPAPNPMPRLVLSDISVSASGIEGGEYTILTENNPEANPWMPEVVGWTGCVTDASVFGDVLYYSVSANASTEEGREGTITVKLVDPNTELPDVVGVINVAQGRKPDKNFVKVTAAPATDWCGDYLMVYEGVDGVGARAFDGSKGDVTGTELDSGPSVPVKIENGNIIPAEDALKAVLLHIKFNNHAKAPAGSYTIRNTSDIRCIGVQGKNTGAGLVLNDNTDDRFYQEITYDETNHSVRIYNTNSAGNANTGVFRYSTTLNAFGVIKDEEAADCAHIQLYKLED
ncbi:MAG: hypothetical protein IJS07_08175 [Bacteroidales bacterium]|nr:hypothetical protein [Bacteroidales bacterium]